MSETIDNQLKTLKMAANLLTSGKITKIAIPDPLPPYDYGYPGASYCKQKLFQNGVLENQITKITPDFHISNMNTQTELAMLVNYYKNRQLDKSVVIIAPWFHILRSYITAISEFKNLNSGIKIFTSSTSYNPHKIVTHSQGILKGTTRMIFYNEIEKCKNYKNLITVDDALETFKQHHHLHSS